MNAKMRLLGVDYGTVRVGLAICDSEQIIASPLATYQRRDAGKDAEFFRGLVHAEEVGGQAVLGRQSRYTTPWLTERHGYDPT